MTNFGNGPTIGTKVATLGYGFSLFRLPRELYITSLLGQFWYFLQVEAVLGLHWGLLKLQAYHMVSFRQIHECSINIQPPVQVTVLKRNEVAMAQKLAALIEKTFEGKERSD